MVPIWNFGSRAEAAVREERLMAEKAYHGGKGLGYNRGVTWGLIGHAWAVDLLRRHLQEGEVRHAYLLAGPEGIGKRTLGLRFAQSLTCLNPGQDGDFCDECRVCRQVKAGVHPDFHLVARVEGKSEIAIDQVRELQRQLALSPMEARRRVALLVDFDEASDGAANALLKTLEEPSGETVLVVTARSAEAVLPTIASRCEVLALRPVAASEIEAGLAEAGADGERARLLASLASGRPGWAIAAQASPAAVEARSRVLDELRSLLKASRAERFAFADKLQQDSERTRLALETWLTLWRDVLVVAHGAEVRITNLDRMPVVEALAREVGKGRARTALLAVERTLTSLERYANARLALEVLMLDLPYLPG
jgi:DNA polymerase III subunit delta'